MFLKGKFNWNQNSKRLSKLLPSSSSLMLKSLSSLISLLISIVFVQSLPWHCPHAAIHGMVTPPLAKLFTRIFVVELQLHLMIRRIWSGAASWVLDLKINEYFYHKINFKTVLYSVACFKLHLTGTKISFSFRHPHFNSFKSTTIHSRTFKWTLYEWYLMAFSVGGNRSGWRLFFKTETIFMYLCFRTCANVSCLHLKVLQ